MKIAKLISMLGLIAMSLVLIYAFAYGDFAAEGAWLISHPWGIVSLVDLYVGFVIFSMWIVYRERSLVIAGVWVVLMMVLGFWAGALYTLIALQTCGNDWKRFWYGNRSS
jgi:hypothetical protein